MSTAAVTMQYDSDIQREISDVDLTNQCRVEYADESNAEDRHPHIESSHCKYTYRTRGTHVCLVHK